MSLKNYHTQCYRLTRKNDVPKLRYLSIELQIDIPNLELLTRFYKNNNKKISQKL